MVQNCELYWEMIKSEYEMALHPSFRCDTNLQRTEFGDEIGLLGAAALSMDLIKD